VNAYALDHRAHLVHPAPIVDQEPVRDPPPPLPTFEAVQVSARPGPREHSAVLIDCLEGHEVRFTESEITIHIDQDVAGQVHGLREAARQDALGELRRGAPLVAMIVDGVRMEAAHDKVRVSTIDTAAVPHQAIPYVLFVDEESKRCFNSRFQAQASFADKWCRLSTPLET
jgi:hypothetical protein